MIKKFFYSNKNSSEKLAVYFKLRFSLSYRDVEESMSIRGVKVDHATIQRWVFKFTPLDKFLFLYSISLRSVISFKK